MSGYYGQDLAYIHDTGFGGFSVDAACGLLPLLRREGIRQGLAVDLGCGSGWWAKALTNDGYQVLGVDVSPAMIRLARRRAPRGTFKIASLHRARLPACAAVTALGEAVQYGAKARNLERLFRRVFFALRPGGLFIFDVRESDTPRTSGVQGRDWAIILRVQRRGRELTRRMTVFRKVGRLFRRSEATHRLRLMQRDEVLKSLRSAGFLARTVGRYGSEKFPAGLVGFIARKPRRGARPRT